MDPPKTNNNNNKKPLQCSTLPFVCPLIREVKALTFIVITEKYINSCHFVDLAVFGVFLLLVYL